MLRTLEARRKTGQRELAECMGVSFDKADYSLKALVDKGLAKVRNFRNSKNKLAHAHLLTHGGVAAKAALTVRLLKRKMGECGGLQRESDALRAEADGRS